MNLTASGIPLSMIRAMNLTNTALYRTKFRMGRSGAGGSRLPFAFRVSVALRIVCDRGIHV